MAMRVPQTGLASMMKDGSSHMSGMEEAVFRNIKACRELFEVVQTSLGPNGMNKMIINHLEKLFVTNDAATIIRELEVEHPAAKLLVLAAQHQEQELGDGTNLVLTFAGELLDQATELLKMGLHPSEIISGYDKACVKALSELEENLVAYKMKDCRDTEEVVKALRTVLASKQYGYEDMLAKVVADACVEILPKNPKNFNVDNIRVVKIPGASVHETTMVKGMVVRRSPEGNITSVSKAKVAVFACPMDAGKTETKGTVLLKNADDLLKFSGEEESRLDQCIKEIAEAGTNVVVAGSSVSDLAVHYLEKYNIMTVRVQSKFDLRRMCKVIGATALARLGAPTPEEFGYCDSVKTKEFGDQLTTVFVQDESATQLATIIIRGATTNILDDVERAVDDAVNVFKQITRDGRFVAGAGATEIELARRIMMFGETCPGLDQYAIKNYASAFEAIPRTLATNAGADSTELVSKLYASHKAGGQNMGFDIEGLIKGDLIDAKDAFILDHLKVKSWAIKLATNAATTVLSIDQIIMAKQAGGPRMPKNAADQDPDDDVENPNMM
ncbi:T-complex protein 1 subunit theta [Sphaeroforma arctica JP610]|uniref:CCT-theta n=1 Tax=Sphaeroforma arctica JP610 TaxID=667725 RepID=A0A0L0G7Z6_9EUKA|nr:T-complex protein 1 subunit theta [Sphaeroforma arctica JP610]KNC85016.1 T-complex protein 1 subunit theta [Sphaeroforma arctica JP610]|eukprot:XP_014158918.1 T-complex protein 1 subunit theta [Sphaeroforma arctica JP610]